MFLPDTPQNALAPHHLPQLLGLSKTPSCHRKAMASGKDKKNQCQLHHPKPTQTGHQEEATGCVTPATSHQRMAQPAPASQQGGRRVPAQGQAAAAAHSHPARSGSCWSAQVHWSCTTGSWVGAETSLSWHRREAHGPSIQEFWAYLLKFHKPKRFLVEALMWLSHRNRHPSSELGDGSRSL